MVKNKIFIRQSNDDEYKKLFSSVSKSSDINRKSIYNSIILVKDAINIIKNHYNIENEDLIKDYIFKNVLLIDKK